MHEITIDMNSTLDSHTVENIVKQYVENRTGKIVAKVESMVIDHVFTGVAVTYHSEKPAIDDQTKNHKTPHVVDKTFKLVVY
jgi:hypothetical protein